MPRKVWEIQVGGATAKIVSGDLKSLSNVLRFQNPLIFRPKRQWLPGESAWHKPIITYTNFLKKSGEFPIGFLDRIRKAIGSGPKVHIRNSHMGDEIEPERTTDLDPESCHGVVARDYQLAAAHMLLLRQTGVAEIATGGGKTLVMSLILGHFVRELGWNCLVLVPTTALLRQNHDEIHRFLGDDVKVVMVGSGRKSVSGQVVIGMPQTLIQGAKHRDGKGRKVTPTNSTFEKFLSGVDALFIDECHFTGAKTWFDVAMACTNTKARYGFSGTAKTDQEVRDARLEAVAGPIVFRKKSVELWKAGFLAEPILYFLLDPNIYDPVPSDAEYAEAYMSGIASNQKYNRFLAKLAATIDKSGRQVLILTRRRKQANFLMKLLAGRGMGERSAMVDGTAPEFKREAVKAKFKDGELGILVATKIFDVGIDLPQTDALVMAGAEKARVGLKQRIGRVLRPSKGKENALIFDFSHDAHWYLLRQAVERVETYQREKIRLIQVDNEETLLEYASGQRKPEPETKEPKRESRASRRTKTRPVRDSSLFR